MPSYSRNSGYSASQLSSMQQDAIERVRDMQRRAQARVDASNRQAAQPSPKPQAESNPPAPAPVPASASTPEARPQAAEVSRVLPASPQQGGSAIKGILERLGMDGEAGLILLLLFLLLNEGANQTVVLALAYVLMG